jgi:hypothetical protein
LGARRHKPLHVPLCAIVPFRVKSLDVVFLARSRAAVKAA